MTRLTVLVLAAFLPAGCAGVVTPPPDTARLSPQALGGFADPDVTAVNIASWAFADSGRTYGRPIEGARAVASLDYIAGQLSTSPRWENIDPLTKVQLLQARGEVRRALGIPATAPSQAVVDGLVRAADAMAAGDQAAAAASLHAPAFTTIGDQMIARLGNLPYIQVANVATSRAAGELFDSNTGSPWTQ